ncbi:hypothetical protein A1Q1_01007 [Trichosporon asahii var. asahii CBS 2479]|uniref:Fructose-bisphosphate aldolase n=1 Tax=Trichosporon asahii var. asahii (strain ATCC 90039 / CBS 2479 / JCM 2466 / KCTC 7840 / NBRC 103889/ NCYC 2677 / UAMH 7654) TaxID=1186058 RepID=J4UEW7_TRIAS|nr:hypothetical protein A1Q1_01007 [Trichosporon asahii var. asahii CBS 2479]EJT49855.1 hypothetical protein A1Q1_01007 [Trichosporon asahii var. asahii CBS 2479]
MSGLTSNRTLQILKKAQEGGYAVNAQVVYDAGQARAYVDACERKRSPGILMLFPISVQQQGGAFLRYCLDIAHNASVPISVHLDHATSAEQLELVLGLADKGTKFDSIMVDASHADTDEENIAIARPWIERCNRLGIATEVELGRLEGGEAGLREITGAMLTDPAKAEEFVKNDYREGILDALVSEDAVKGDVLLSDSEYRSPRTSLSDSPLRDCVSESHASENHVSENRYLRNSHTDSKNAFPENASPETPIAENTSAENGLTSRTGADILAPSIGNLHGSYKFLPGGPQFDWSILEDLHARFGSSPTGPYLCMHGTDELSDEFFRRIVKCGVSKINVNSWLREPYVSTLSKALQTKTMPEAIDDAHEAMVKEAERFCDLLGSTGKA